MTPEEINTPEKEEEIAKKLCEAYMILVKVLKPYRSLVCINNDNAENHPMQTIKVLTPWADQYMTDALREKMNELLDGIPEDIDSFFNRSTRTLARWEFACSMPWYLDHPKYALENYEKEYENK